MEHSRQVSRVLHDEHVAVIGLLERFSEFLARTGTPPPDPDDTEAKRMLSDVAAAVETEITAHFGFEEADLFPILDAAGYTGLGEALTEEHKEILPVGRDVARRAHTGRGEGFSDVAWNDFRRLGAEFAGRLIDHARREEDGLLPLLELALDEETDVRLASEHAMRR